MTIKELKNILEEFDDDDSISFNLFDEENRTIAHASRINISYNTLYYKFCKNEINFDINIDPKYGGSYTQMKLDYLSKVNKCKSLEKTINRLGNENKKLKEFYKHFKSDIIK